MVKRILLFLLQFVLFVVLLGVGGNWDVINLTLQLRALQNHTTAFNPIPVLKYPFGASHILIADGVLFATVLLVLILLFEALRRRLRPWAGLTVLAYVLALATAFVAKLGLPPSN